MLQLSFHTTIIEWRGPPPYFYAPVPMELAAEIERIKRQASYGWGVIPVEAVVGAVRFSTSLFPREGTYLLPIKLAVRRELGLTVGDDVDVAMSIRARGD